MATPQSTTSYEDSGSKKLEQITFRFCSECSNMLYPKEDEDAHKLQFTCRTCQYTEEAQSTCVFRNVLNNSAGETAGVTQDVGSDPTPQKERDDEEKTKRSQSQFVPWTDYDDIFAEYDEELMEDIEHDAYSHTSTDLNSDNTLESIFLAT
ncbi:DNA-directed RNA polymerase, M/15kDa subunit [Metarhizium rileyi]|uniref:DNA-directed RNA polymerase II core subunit rpb9 n=1 Tax=Metarhizium rileyi (strain RCEF 4871) TaxID=1649241 RepID=A0A167JK79_METRR|nr:DNA-directed RNA polymerase, M/15kDa subunit [Metarhizium rileyi RCEF 4871]TWU75764.1 DNA-directed RNA polymerase II core subunit rpb9 [Metarhizium rileyi]